MIYWSGPFVDLYCLKIAAPYILKVPIGREESRAPIKESDLKLA